MLTEWIALALAVVVYVGFCFGAYRTGGLAGAAFGIGVTAILFALSVMA